MATKFLIFLLLISSFACAQVMQTNSTPGGYKFKALKADTMLILPSGLDTPKMTNPKYGEPTAGAIFYKTADSTVWLRSAKKWNKITGGSSYLVSNGIYLAGDTIKLGGDLIQNTEISGDETYGFSFHKITTFEIGLPSAGSGKVLTSDAQGFATWEYLPGRFGNDTATIVMAKVHNNAGVTLVNGDVVYLNNSGTNSDAPSVRKAINKGDSTSANTFGFVTGTIAVNDTGYIILSGKIEKLNTSAFSNGDVIYLDSIAGKYTTSKPKAPYHLVYLGAVVKSNNGNGSIFVKVQNGYELEELHNVQINSPGNNQILVYSDTSKLWKNRSAYSVIDTATMLQNYVRSVYRKTGSDSVFVVRGTGAVFGFRDSIGSGGITTIGTISGTGNANGLSISGSTLTAHPATATTAGMVTTGAQTWAGEKTLNDNLKFGAMKAINWGTNFGASSLILYDGGAGDRYGWGLSSSTMQFYIPSGVGKTFSYRNGGDFSSGVELMSLSGNDGKLYLNGYQTIGTSVRRNNAGLNVNNSPIAIGDIDNGFHYTMGRNASNGIFEFTGYQDGYKGFAFFAQDKGVGINGVANSSSALDIQSTTRGFLPPRLTATQRTAIASPAAGLMVYDTDSSRYMLYGSSWKGLAYTDAGGGGGGSTTSASGTGISLVNGSSLVKRLKAGFNTIVTDNTDSVTISRDTLTQTLTDGATVTFSATAGVSARVTLGGNRTLSITNMNNGMYLTLVVIQDGTGGRTLTLPAGTRVVNGGAGAVTLSSAANARDILTFFEIGDVIYCNVGRNYN